MRRSAPRPSGPRPSERTRRPRRRPVRGVRPRGARLRRARTRCCSPSASSSAWPRGSTSPAGPVAPSTTASTRSSAPSASSCRSRSWPPASRCSHRPSDEDKAESSTGAARGRLGARPRRGVRTPRAQRTRRRSSAGWPRSPLAESHRLVGDRHAARRARPRRRDRPHADIRSRRRSPRRRRRDVRSGGVAGRLFSLDSQRRRRTATVTDDACTTRTPTSTSATTGSRSGASPRSRSSRSRCAGRRRPARPSSSPSSSVPAPKASPWKLPSLSLLERAGAHDIDVSLVEERGRVLEAALAQHGVETRLVGMVIGPSVTRYELELGARREGGAAHEPAQGHRVRDRVARRPHPRSDPGPPGHRRRGAERGAPDRAPRRHPRVARGAAAPSIRSRSRSAATSTARPC